jgi:hypothetical protein
LSRLDCAIHVRDYLVKRLGEWRINELEREHKAEHGGLSRPEWAIQRLANTARIKVPFASHSNDCTWKDIGQSGGVLARAIPCQNEQW